MARSYGHKWAEELQEKIWLQRRARALAPSSIRATGIGVLCLASAPHADWCLVSSLGSSCRLGPPTWPASAIPRAASASGEHSALCQRPTEAAARNLASGHCEEETS
jgi:hypothetical protein